MVNELAYTVLEHTLVKLNRKHGDHLLMVVFLIEINDVLEGRKVLFTISWNWLHFFQSKIKIIYKE